MSDKPEVPLAIERLKATYDCLREALDRLRDDLDRDGAIQCSALAAEIAWKTHRSPSPLIEIASPLDCPLRA